jgi:uncharacterized protein
MQLTIRMPDDQMSKIEHIAKELDLPMDYADATLVCLAMDSGIYNIITFDQKDFNIYRVKNKPFVITP